MAIELAQLHQLQTARGQAALQDAMSLAPTLENFLGCRERLAKQHPLPLAAAALEIALLRQKATAKFHRAQQMYFTKDALEQASREGISRYRARRFDGARGIVELGGGIGGDSLGLAATAPLISYEQDPVRAEMAAANLAAYELQADHRAQDFETLDWRSTPAIWLDPTRRSSRGRIHSTHHYQPALSIVQRWQHVPRWGVKLSPAVDQAELTRYGGELEFISVVGELKEAVLWGGDSITTPRRATLLDSSGTWHTLATESTESCASTLPQAILYEPDPAILRAGMVQQLAQQLRATQISPEIAYLTATTAHPTPWARTFEVVAHFPFQLKKIRAELRARHVGNVTVKKRGSALDVDQFTQSLHLSPRAPQTMIVFLTQVQRKPWVILAKPIPQE